MSTTIETETGREAAVDTTDETTPAAPARPAPPVREASRLRKALSVLRTTVVVLVLVAAAVFGGNHVVRQRLAAQAFVDPGTAVLTAQPITVGSADAGVVSKVLINEKESVTAGATLAQVTLTADGGGEARVQALRAPAAGVVTEINVAPGQVARAGEPVVTLYDPAKLTFEVDVPLETLRRLRLGMTAYVSGPGLPSRVATTLQRVEPKVDPAGGAIASDRLTVILEPDRSALTTVRTLVPGLQFDVVVDTTTAAGRTPAVNSA